MPNPHFIRVSATCHTCRALNTLIVEDYMGYAKVTCSSCGDLLGTIASLHPETLPTTSCKGHRDGTLQPA